MVSNRILVRFAPEINIKSPRVKLDFLRRLKRNLRSALDKGGFKFSIEGDWTRLFIHTDDLGVLEAGSRVFGISSLAPLDFTTEPTLQAMEAGVTAHYATAVAQRSFAVRARRTRVEGFTSVDVEQRLGAVLYPFARGVDLKNPEVSIQVEVRPEGAHFFTRRVLGPGGLPLGVEGRVLVLISGGFDSAAASWLMMKRGVSVDYCFFNLAGAAHERSVLAVAQNLAANWGHGEGSQFCVVDFTGVVAAIQKDAKAAYNQVVLKRMMLSAAEGLVALNPGRGYAAIVTGESIGQVSSQTLHNIAAINDASSVPVLRPLLCFDKEEILDLSRRIGTFALSACVREYCSITQGRPVTQASAARARAETVLIDPSLVPTALGHRRSMDLRNIDLSRMGCDYLFADDVPEGAAVVDLREAYQFAAWHYPGARHLPIDILFEDLSNLPKNRTYILYCPFGLKSAVAAERLQRLGYEAYGFKGGTKALRATLVEDEAWT